MFSNLKTYIFLVYNVFLIFFLVGCSVHKNSKDSALHKNSYYKSDRAAINKPKTHNLHPLLLSSVVKTLGYDNSSYHIIKNGKNEHISHTNNYGFTTLFNKNGITVRPTINKTSWVLEMYLRGVGYNNNISNVPNPVISTTANRIQYQRGSVTEWYINSPIGIEQGFTIHTAPAQNPNGNSSLVVELVTKSNLQPELNKNKKGVVWKNKHGNRVFNYSNLYAFDSERKELPSYFTRADGKISIIVDDSNAEYPINIDPIMFVETRAIPGDLPLDQFGYAVDIRGDNAIVGAVGDIEPPGGPPFLSGSASVRGRNTGGINMWGQVKKLTASDGEVFDDFGVAVSIDGDFAVVGAYRDDDVTVGGTCDSDIDCGSVYIFHRDTPSADMWGQIKKLTASDASAFDNFGRSVAISGNFIIVGAPGDDAAGVCDPDTGTNCDRGAAYIFEKDFPLLDDWGQRAKLTASDAADGDLFGFAVSISGNTAIIGTPTDDNVGGTCASDADCGSGYIFQQDSSGGSLPDWEDGSNDQVKKIIASDASSCSIFGFSVDIDSDIVVVGGPGLNTFGLPPCAGSLQGSAYIFERDSDGMGGVLANNWGETAALTASDGSAGDGDEFGHSVSIDIETAVVGSPGEDSSIDTGAIYIYERDITGVWSELGKATASDAGVTVANQAVVMVDEATGDRTIISDDVTGSGPAFVGLEGIDFEDNPDIVVVDGLTVKRVDPATGDRSIVSDNTGLTCDCDPLVDPFCVLFIDAECLFSPVGIAADKDGLPGKDTIFVTDLGNATLLQPGRVLSVDPNSGNRAVFNNNTVHTVGLPFGIDIENDGNLVITDFQLIVGNETQACFDCFGGDLEDCPDCAFGPNPCTECDIINPSVARIDSGTGDVTQITDTSMCAGRTFNRPMGITVLSDGDLSVAAINVDDPISPMIINDAAILKVDSSTGVCSVLNDTSVSFPQGMSTGSALSVDNLLNGGAVVSFDETTGAATIVSDSTTGSGPPFRNPYWIVSDGAGTSYVTQLGSEGELVGFSTGIRGDTIIVGAPFKDNARGEAYIFRFPIVVNSLIDLIVDGPSQTTNVPPPPLVNTGCDVMGFFGEFLFDTTLSNTSADQSLTNILIELVSITNGNFWWNTDGPQGGTELTVPLTPGEDYEDGILDPGESITLPFEICLTDLSTFDFFVNVRARLEGPVMGAAGAVEQLILIVDNLFNNVSNSTASLTDQSNVSVGNSTSDIATTLSEPLFEIFDNLIDGNDKNNNANCGKIKRFKNLVKKLEKDGEITTDQADLLNDSADNVTELLGCK